MSEEVKALIALQGILRVTFIRAGVDEQMALQLSLEALHLFVTSIAVREEYYQAYEERRRDYCLDAKTQ